MLSEDYKTLLAKIRKGDKAAFEQLFNLYYTTLSVFAAHIVNSKEDAEDIVQDVFAKIWIQRNQLEKIDSLKEYLFTSVRNNSLTFLRNHKHKSEELQELPLEEDIVSYMVEEETNRLLLQAVSTLPKRSAEVINLGLQGKKMDEIAQYMGISINTVKTLKYEGIQKLKNILQSFICWIFLQFKRKNI